MELDAEIEPVLEETCSIATSGQRVIVDVNIDCRRPQMTKGGVKTNLSHFSTSQKIRCRPRGQAAFVCVTLSAIENKVRTPSDTWSIRHEQLEERTRLLAAISLAQFSDESYNDIRTCLFSRLFEWNELTGMN